MQKRVTAKFALAGLLFFAIELGPVAAQTVLLDFNFQHGTVIDNQYAGLGSGINDYGITISASGGPGVAIVYDSELGGTNGTIVDGADPDLERLVAPLGGGPGGVDGDNNYLGWDGGNLGAGRQAGGVLIVQENGPQSSTPTYGFDGNGLPVTSASLFDPDDRAGGGSDSIITFTIDPSKNYNYFQLNLADLEESANSWVVTLTGFNSSNQLDTNIQETFFLADLIAADPTITQGNNHINQLPVNAILDPTITRLAQVEVNFGSSSGSISNIVFSETPIPEPSTLFLGGLAGALLMLRRRR